MKKFGAFLCGVLMLLSLAACGEDKEPAQSGGDNGGRKLGLGSVTTLAADGKEKMTVKTTVAAVVLDKDGKILDCDLDEAEIPLEIKNGMLTDVVDLLTKGERDDDDMLPDRDDDSAAAQGRSWEDQVEAFCDHVEGMTGAQVSGIAATDGKSEQIEGCDLVITDFVQAVHAATENAKDKKIAAADDLQMAVTVAKSKSWSDAKPQFNVEMAAVTVDEADRITACMTDAAEVKLTIEDSVFATAAGAMHSKRAMGDTYGMKQASPIKKEWYEQADAFDAYAVGKTAAELQKTALTDDGKTDAISTCTISIDVMLKNAVKAAKE
ncbi:MAG: hypothetical protein IJB26_03720 [Clostridia bacterium]|nr:hypothetical protein [Clostridia bacterium]